jgi:hypothetical protein
MKLVKGFGINIGIDEDVVKKLNVHLSDHFKNKKLIKLDNKRDLVIQKLNEYKYEYYNMVLKKAELESLIKDLDNEAV